LEKRIEQELCFHLSPKVSRKQGFSLNLVFKVGKIVWGVMNIAVTAN
jgi:hypothetical protein